MYRLIFRGFVSCMLSLTILLSSSVVYGDDIIESINEALELYKNGQYTEAVGSLTYASQLIQQMKGENLTSFLPQPLEGWTMGKTESQAAGAAMFGGGITAEREYRRDSSFVKIEIITDSPMLQGVMMMLSNPMFAANDGGKLQRFGREKGLVKYDDQKKSGTVQLVVANRFLISVEGRKIEKKDLVDYTEAIDFKQLAQMP